MPTDTGGITTMRSAGTARAAAAGAARKENEAAVAAGS
jgi:hypothetical protein